MIDWRKCIQYALGDTIYVLAGNNMVALEYHWVLDHPQNISAIENVVAAISRRPRCAEILVNDNFNEQLL